MNPRGREKVVDATRVRAARMVLIVGVLAFVVVSAVILSDRAPRRSGTDLTTAAGGYPISLGAGLQLCQPGEQLPANTGALRIGADPGAASGSALGAELLEGTRVLSSGRLAPGWHAGTIAIPLRRLVDAHGGTVCVHNLGAHTVRLAGELPALGFEISIAGRTFPGRMRIEYLRPGRESWLSLTPTIMHRFSLGKSDLVRHWAAAAVLVLMLLVVALALRTILKEAS